MNTSLFEYPFENGTNQLFYIHSNSLSCYLTNFGARIVALQSLDKNSEWTDVVLGFNTLEEYLNANDTFHGATIGRFANRIGNGAFDINGTTYNLPQNSGSNCIHGGVSGFHTKFWKCISNDQSSVTFQYIAAHLEEGFPGELITTVTYSIDDTTLRIEYEASSDSDTIINFTNHAYFNLNGEGNGSILNHDLLFNADYYTPINEKLLPTGSLDMVLDTPFDFTSMRKIGAEISSKNDQLSFGNGYDHNFVLNQYIKDELNFGARVIGDRTGIQMETWTSEPGIQLYTANHFDKSDKGKSGKYYNSREAFCLETQHFPDSPNQLHFPTALLLENQTFNSITEYRFSIV